MELSKPVKQVNLYTGSTSESEPPYIDQSIRHFGTLLNLLDIMRLHIMGLDILRTNNHLKRVLRKAHLNLFEVVKEQAASEVTIE